MKKDLLIGAADLYSWKDVNVWATSARESGFTGDIALLAYRVNDDIIINSKNLAIDVYKIDTDSFGQAISHNAGGRDTQAHQLRFFHAWQLLNADNAYKHYENVITTDVRDVVFQRNPSEYLKRTHSPLVASSEGITYANEAWGMNNMLSGFGPLVSDIAKNWIIYNVGITAGESSDVMGLYIALYNMTVGRYIPSDQSAYAILVNQTMQNSFQITDHSDRWACQCGTMLDPQKAHYKPYLLDPIPVVKDGFVYNNRNELFTIVHQWDRVSELKPKIEARYA